MSAERVFWYTAENNETVLNLYTDSSTLYSGCPVTTWYWSTSDYQRWRPFTVSYGNNNYFGYACRKDITYCLQIRRLGDTPEVNIAPILNNYLYDVHVTFTNPGGGPQSLGSGLMKTYPRSIHLSNMYINVGNTISGWPSNYYAHYCNWQPSTGSYFVAGMSYWVDGG